MADQIPRFILPLRRGTTLVLYAWLDRTDLNLLPIEHPTEKQAFYDIHGWLEFDTDGSYAYKISAQYGGACEGRVHEGHRWSQSLRVDAYSGAILSTSDPYDNCANK